MKIKPELQKLKNKLKSAIFLEIVFWIVLITALCCAGNAIFYNKYVKPNLYTIEFRDVDGIIKGSPVRFMGIVIGHVRNLKYENGAINVQIIVTKKGVKIPSGSIASVEFSGIAGSKSVEIMPPDTDLDDIGIISKETLRIADVLDSFEYLGKVFGSLKDFVDAISQENAYRIFDTVTKTTKAIEKANTGMNSAQKQSKDFEKRVNTIIEGQKKIGVTLDEASKSAKKLNSYLKK